MTKAPDSPVRKPRSLSFIILLGVVMCVAAGLLHGVVLLIYGEPIPPGGTWARYLALRVVMGACAGLVLYGMTRVADDWARYCLFAVALGLLMNGEIDDFTNRPLGLYLAGWVLGSVIIGLLGGTLIYALTRRARARKAASQTPGTDG